MISVVIPVYNTAKYLKKCVYSITNQTYKELQIILINDGSTDDSLKIMEELAYEDSRIEVIDLRHEGVSAARNAGIKAAAGEFLSFIDSDDWIELNTYQIVLDIMNQNDADAVYFDWTEEYSDGTTLTKRREKKIVLNGDEIIQKYFENDIPLRISSGFFKATLFSETSFEVGRSMGEDMLASFLAIAQTNRIVYIALPLYHRYHRLGSLGNHKGFKARDFGTATCTDAMIEYIWHNRPEFLQMAYTYSFNFYMVTLNYMMYYRCEQQYVDIYTAVVNRLKELWGLINSPIKQLPKELSCAYLVFLLSKSFYHYAMVVYYRYVKKELGGKRQR